jgi:hypothetical protein
MQNFSVLVSSSAQLKALAAGAALVRDELAKRKLRP